MSEITPDALEVEELEQAAAWRLRLVDADPTDTVSANAIGLLQALAEDLRRQTYAGLSAELLALTNWLGESDVISDYAELTAEYRAGIGITGRPANGGDYLRDLLAIARSLV